MSDSTTLPSVDSPGSIRMADVSRKPNAIRTAVAAGRVRVGDEVLQRVRDHDVRKGDVLTTAQIAGIMAAKQTSQLLPLCHDVQMGGVEVEFTFDDDDAAIDIRAYTKSIGVTGVEMEALMAVSISALTIYDMCKSITKEIQITDVHLLAKTGGQSGNWKSEDAPLSTST